MQYFQLNVLYLKKNYSNKVTGFEPAKQAVTCNRPKLTCTNIGNVCMVYDIRQDLELFFSFQCVTYVACETEICPLVRRGNADNESDFNKRWYKVLEDFDKIHHNSYTRY
jgi:hypothetical protein